MLGLRMCWQLLLGWALLLGQPVFGGSESASIEQPPSEEPETDGPVLGEPEDPEPEPAEGEDPLPVLEEPERFPGSEQLEKQETPSDEELQEMEHEERQWLKQEKKKPCSAWVQYLQQISLGHYNKHIYEYHKPYGKASLRIQKAIGSLVYLKMMLVETNCTKEQQPQFRTPFDFMSMEDSFHQFPKQPKCEPVDHSEQECSVSFFFNGRERFSIPTLLHKECKLLHVENKGIFSS